MSYRKLELVFASGCRAKEMEPVTCDWPECIDFFQKHDEGKLTMSEYQAAKDEQRKAEKDGPAWLPCSLVDPAGSRNQANMGQAHFMVLDIDEGLPLDVVESTLRAYEYIIHSSYSHSPKKPKWRVIMPLAEPIPAGGLSEVFDHFNILFDNKLDCACGHDPSRLYYLPRTPKGEVANYVFTHHEGAWVDAFSILTEVASKSAVKSISATANSSTPVGRIDFPTGVGEGKRHIALAKHSGHCLSQGMSAEETTRVCLEWNQLNTPPLDEKEVRTTIKSLASKEAHKRKDAEKALDQVIHDMNGRYVWVQKHASIFRHDFKDYFSPEKLRNQYANTSVLHVVDGNPRRVTHAEAWLKSPARRQCLDVVFRPGSPAEFDNCINTWQGWGVEPKEGEITPWINMLNHIFGDDLESRKWAEQWMAYPFQHPGVKMNSAVVLWSARQGVGKSLVGETISKLYGKHAKTIGAAELHSPYNGWASDCQFILGEENASSDHRADSNRLKNLITSPTIHINEKYQPGLHRENRMNFLFTSNHADAFHLELHDRRFFVWEIANGPLPPAFYSDFVKWRDSVGLAALMHHFQALDLTGFDPYASVPMTEAKVEMIEISRSEVERWLSEILDPDTVLRVIGREVATVEELVRVYNAKFRKITSTTSMGKSLGRVSTFERRRVVTHKGRKTLVTLVNHDKWKVKPNDDWMAEYRKISPHMAMIE